jgi:predicted AlkP superfamily pyrophosphatase or phosphodiesterase
LLTGVHGDKHGVNMNINMDKLRMVPTIFKLAKDWNSAITIIAHSHWEPIIAEIIEPGLLIRSSTGPDDIMAKHMVKDINSGKGDLHFIQLDDIDGAGHEHGYAPDIQGYVRKIEQTDALVGLLLQSVERRSGQEDWLVCLVSDHGGNGKAHGGMTLGELTIAFIIAGNAVTQKGPIPGDEESAPRIVDVVPNIARFLGMPASPTWDGTFNCIDQA